MDRGNTTLNSGNRYRQSGLAEEGEINSKIIAFTEKPSWWTKLSLDNKY